METNIMIVTVTKCSPKDKESYTRIDYVPLDRKVKSEKVKGNFVAAMFSNTVAFDKLTEDYFYIPVKAKISYVANPSNMMKPRARLESITSKNGTINLL